MKTSALTTAAILVNILSLSFISPVAAQSFPDLFGQEHIHRGTMDRNRRSHGQKKTLFNPSGNSSSDGHSRYEERRAKVVIEADGVNVRTGPGFNHRAVNKVPNGGNVIAIGNTTDGKWTQLRCDNCPPDVEIWIFSDFIQMY